MFTTQPHGIFPTLVPVHVIFSLCTIQGFESRTEHNILHQVIIQNMRYELEMEDYNTWTVLILKTCKNFLPKIVAMTNNEVRRIKKLLLSSC